MPLLVTGWWLAFGLANVIQYRQMVEADGRSYTWSLALAPMVSALLWVPLTWLALVAARRAPIGSAPLGRALVTQLGATAAVVLFRAMAVLALNDVIGWYRELPSLPSLLLTSVQNNVFLYLMVAGAAHAVYYAQSSRLRERQLAQARLHTLAAQMQPHFLFNALNTVASLVHDNPHAAEKVIVRLSALLRHTVGVKAEEQVPLREELTLLESYLDIERARFEERLLVEWDIAADAANALVPHFLLQPIVENSIVHGLRPVPGAVTIRIFAKRDDNTLRVVVADTGAGFEPAGNGNGFGLSTVLERLESLYPGRASLTIESSPGKGTSTTLTLPYLASA